MGWHSQARGRPYADQERSPLRRDTRSTARATQTGRNSHHHTAPRRTASFEHDEPRHPSWNEQAAAPSPDSIAPHSTRSGVSKPTSSWVASTKGARRVHTRFLGRQPRRYKGSNLQRPTESLYPSPLTGIRGGPASLAPWAAPMSCLASTPQLASITADRGWCFTDITLRSPAPYLQPASAPPLPGATLLGSRLCQPSLVRGRPQGQSCSARARVVASQIRKTSVGTKRRRTASRSEPPRIPKRKLRRRRCPALLLALSTGEVAEWPIASPC